MKKDIIEFGKRMDAAEDKITLVEYAEGSKAVLDLGAGTGKISRDIAKAYNAKVDAVDIQFKDNCQNSDNVTYYGEDIRDFLSSCSGKKYDCIILSAILHELSDEYLECLVNYLPNLMTDNCRIIVREPFFDTTLGPILKENARKFIELTSNNIKASKAVEYMQLPKLSNTMYNPVVFGSSVDWANLSFVVSYGEQSWEREKKELRYARSLNWCKKFFNFTTRPFTGFQVLPTLDTTYRNHFVNAGIPGEAFDLIQYTGMLVIIDYSK